MDIFFPGSGAEQAGVSGRWDHLMGVDIDIWHPGADDADVSAMMADVLEAIGTDTKWGDQAVETQQPTLNDEWERKGRLIGGPNIQFKIMYRTAQWAI